MSMETLVVLYGMAWLLFIVTSPGNLVLSTSDCNNTTSTWKRIEEFCDVTADNCSNNINENTDYTTEKKVHQALKKCIPLGIGAVAVVVVALLITICFLCAVKRFIRRRKRRGQSHEDAVLGAEQRRPFIRPRRHSNTSEMSNYSSTHRHSNGSRSSVNSRRTNSYKRRETLRLEELERENRLVEGLAEVMFRYKFLRPLPDLGSRLQKFWYSVETRTWKGVQIIVKSSNLCRLNLRDEKTLKLLTSLLKKIEHPNLLEIHNLNFKKNHVGIQVGYALESVRDYIFEVDPLVDWNVKYTGSTGTQVFSKGEISRCGQQVLKAVETLYGLGFRQIGQIHSGNVFIVGDRYLLGGFENALLGYRTSCYSRLQREELLDKMDAIMFGHLMYEMSTGCLLVERKMMLSWYDIRQVKDKNLRAMVQFVFDSSKKNRPCREIMDRISAHQFFLYPYEDEPDMPHVPPIQLLFEEAQLIAKVFSRDLSLNVVIENMKEKFDIIVELPQLGWRTEKVWAKARSEALQMEGLLTAVLLPESCPVYVESNSKTIETLLSIQHEHILNLKCIEFVKIDRQFVVVTFQDFVAEGSLKDKIYQSPPIADWDAKYYKIGRSLRTKEVKRYTTQILQAMVHLSSLPGSEDSLNLTHIHTGNILMCGNICRVAGFENTILGYPPRKSKLFEGSLNKLNFHTLGHVIFEMCTGMDLRTTIPMAKDYHEIPRELQPLLKYIFDGQSANISRIFEFLHISPTEQSETAVLPSEVRFVLKKVRKGKARNQDDLISKRKQTVQIGFGKFLE